MYHCETFGYFPGSMNMSHDDLLETFAKATYTCVAYQTDASLATTAYLLRATGALPALSDCYNVNTIECDDTESFQWINAAQQQMKTQTDTPTWLSHAKVQYRLNVVAGKRASVLTHS